MAFDVNRLVSLRPDVIDFGPFADLVNEEFRTLWQQILDGVWAQWRYEHQLPSYRGPELELHPRASSAPAASIGPAADDRSLVFCGGGKDSLIAAKLFEELDQPFESFAYSHSIYGDHELQHRLLDGLLDHCAPGARHRLAISDDFLGSEIDLEPFGVRSVTAAETPGSLFLALPLALAHRHRNLVLAHEKSADEGNLVWELTGEEINHQWGKSLAAEALLDDYLRRHLLADVRYFSVLKPVRDTIIFPALGHYLAAVPATHSCNVEKPWCRRCPKCVYVWLGYAAYLPRSVVLETLGENLFDVEANLGWFAQLLGQEGHLPFECVGQVEESRLALALASRRGWTGLAIERFAGPIEHSVTPASVAHLFEVAGHGHRIPPQLSERVITILERRATEARQFVGRTLARAPDRLPGHRGGRSKKREGPRPSLPGSRKEGGPS